MESREWVSRAKVLCLVIFVLMMCVSATANNLILAPTATTLTLGQVRAEAALQPAQSNNRYYWLGSGIQQCELNAVRFDKQGQESENLVNIQYSFIPETMLSPAIAFGVTDIASQSAEGIGTYVVVTRHLPVGPASIFIKDFAATAGVGLFGIRGPFTGFEAKLPMHFFVQAEYDSRDFNAAVGWQPTSLFRVKAYTIRQEFFVGAELVPVTY